MTIERIAIAPSAATAADCRAIVDRARLRGFRRFVLKGGRSISRRAGEEYAIRTPTGLRIDGRPDLVPLRTVRDRAGLERALGEGERRGAIVIDWTGDRVIPLENLIARGRTRIELWTYARTPSEVPAALGALEHGAHRVIAVVRSPQEVDEVESVVERSAPRSLDWTTVRLREIRAVGLGDRVLVDTTSMLRPDEGMLVGSAAAFLFHVASEAVGSSFSAARPFRVNAGAAHSYVLLADGTTRYLAELGPGDAVLAAAPTGETRSVRVGRIKIERRPLVVLTASDRGRDRTIFLQEAETVRLSTSAGRVATTRIRPGAVVRGVRMPPARHLGTAVEETIEER